MKLKSIKNQSRNSTQKRCLKTAPHKSKNNLKMTLKWVSKSERILEEMPLGAPLVVQTVFVIKKWASSAAKCSQGSNNDPKITQKGPPECENELQKWTLLGAQLLNYSITQSLNYSISQLLNYSITQ